MSIPVNITIGQATLIDDPLTDYYIILDDQHCEVMLFTPRMLHGYLDDDPEEDEGMDDRLGYPGVVPLQSPDGRVGSPLTEDVLWYLFDLCVRQQYGFAYGSAGWSRLTRDQKRKIASEFETFYDSRRFLTNHAGIDENYNPIGEAILGQSHRSGFGKQLEVVTVGNLVKAVSHTPRSYLADVWDEVERKVVKRKTPCIQIEVWDGKDPWPNASAFNHDTHPELVHLATNVTPFNVYSGQWSRTGPWRVNSFHFFGGKGSPYAVYSLYPQYIPLNRVRRLRRSELLSWRSPFYP